MAFSQPLSGSLMKKGQTALMCGLCENEPKLKWKCLDCGLMMCQRCRDKVHPKFPSAEDHTIIDIKEISKYQDDSEPKPDLTRIKCDEHSDQKCCLFCETCNILVCQTCVTKTHKKHDFTEIGDEYEIKLKKIRIGQKNIENEMQALIKNEQKLKQLKSAEQRNCEKLKQEILDDEKALIDEIKKHTNKLLNELDQKWETVSKSIDIEAKQLKEKLRQIHEQQNEISQLLDAQNAKAVFSSMGIIFQSKKANIQPLKSSIQGVPKFFHGDKSKILEILGQLQEVTRNLNFDLKVQFETELRTISCILSCPDGSLWICDNFTGIIQNVKANGDNLSVKSNIKTKVFHAALLPSGDLLFSVKQSSTLKLVPSGSTDIQDSVYTVSPLQPTAVHVTSSNKVIVGVKETGPNFPAKGPRKVIVIEHTLHLENLEKCFEYDSHNKPLFSLPLDITSDKRSNMAIVDRVSDDKRGRVVVLNQEGVLRNIYTGHPDVNNEDNSFRPTGIAVTPSDNFVVVDMDNHTLHILNSEGEFITFYNTKEMGILLPRSLSFCSTGQLCIGCSTRVDRNDKAKLFVVNNFLS